MQKVTLREFNGESGQHFREIQLHGRMNCDNSKLRNNSMFREEQEKRNCKAPILQKTLY